ncbi:MAG: tartrate-resistant acid phosphatase type 5 family protein [Novosphingobium sp.]
MMLDRRTFIAGTTALAGAALVPASAKPASASFLVVGDWGREGGFNQREVGTAMGRRAAETGARFVVTTGDNFYEDGVQSVTDPLWKASFEDVYTAPSLQRPWYGVLGNHDYRGSPQAQLDYAKQSTRWRMPSRYYKIAGAEHGLPTVDLFMIDSSPLVVKYRTDEKQALRDNVLAQDTAAQLKWLDDELGRSRAAWKLVFTHHPSYSGGSSHGNTAEMIGQVDPILARHGVQALVFGHDHDMQHIVRDGLHHIGTGCGSQIRPVSAIEGTQWCLSSSGFARLQVEHEMLGLEFRDQSGRQVYRARIGRVAAGAKAA